MGDAVVFLVILQFLQFGIGTAAIMDIPGVGGCTLDENHQTTADFDRG